MVKGAIKPIKLENITYSTGKGLKKYIPKNIRSTLKIEYLEKNTTISRAFKNKLEKNVSEFYTKKATTKEEYFSKKHSQILKEFNSLSLKTDLLSLNEKLKDINVSFNYLISRLQQSKSKETTYQRRVFTAFFKKEKETVKSLVDNLNQINKIDLKIFKLSSDPAFKENISSLGHERTLLTEKTLEKYTELKMNLDLFTSSNMLEAFSL